MHTHEQFLKVSAGVSLILCPEMENSRDDRRRSGRVGSTLGDRYVTGQPHKMQKDIFQVKQPKTEIHLL